MLSNFQTSCAHLDRPQHQVKHWHQAPLRLKPVGDVERNVRNACCWVCPSSSGTCATCNGPTGIPRVWMATSSAWWGARTTSMYCLLLGQRHWSHVGSVSLDDSMWPSAPRPRVLPSFWHLLCSWLFYGRYWCGASCVAGSLAWRQELLGCLSAFSIMSIFP